MFGTEKSRTRVSNEIYICRVTHHIAHPKFEQWRRTKDIAVWHFCHTTLIVAFIRDSAKLSGSFAVSGSFYEIWHLIKDLI